MVIPMAIYLIDVSLRMYYRTFHPGTQMELYAAQILPPGDVICLMMKTKSGKPLWFKPGQYCLINVK